MWRFGISRLIPRVLIAVFAGPAAVALLVTFGRPYFPSVSELLSPVAAELLGLLLRALRGLIRENCLALAAWASRLLASPLLVQSCVEYDVATVDAR